MARAWILALCALLAGGAAAQAPYPSKPVRVVLGFAPGSIQDVLVRLVGDRMGTNMGQTMVIENRVGAGGRIGAEAGAKAPPDGYTIVLGSAGTHVLGVYLVKALPYDPVKDFTPLSLAI